MSHYAGSCLCGGVTFEVNGELRDVIACHCVQCRKTTGNYMSATATEDLDLKFIFAETLAWYESSLGSKRGFCSRCGSTLFWKGPQRTYTSIAAGCIDGPVGKKLAGHIFCDSADDYYEITGGEYRRGQC